MNYLIMGILISLHLITSTVTSLKQMLLARVPNKEEEQTPRQQNSGLANAY